MNIDNNEIIKYAWNYFDLHAKQRTSVFNFFVIFSTVVTTALATTFHQTIRAHYVGIVLGILLIFISFAFWKLDERNKFLTRHGEEALKRIEKEFNLATNDERNPIFIFTSEELRTEQLRKAQKSNFILFRQMSFSTSFNLIYLIYCLIGLTGAILSILAALNVVDFGNGSSDLIILKTSKEAMQLLKSICN